MGRNYLAGPAVDAINAVLAAAGYNFRRLLAWLALLLFAFLFAMARPAASQNQSVAAWSLARRGQNASRLSPKRKVTFMRLFR